MAFDKMQGVAFVTYNGEYSGDCDIVIFDSGDLTESQWEILSDLSDYSKIDYVEAIRDGKDLSEWEQ